MAHTTQNASKPPPMVLRPRRESFRLRFLDFPGKRQTTHATSAISNSSDRGADVRNLVCPMLTRNIKIPMLEQAFNKSVRIEIFSFPCLQPQLVSRRFGYDYKKEMARSGHQDSQELRISFTGDFSQPIIPSIIGPTQAIKDGLFKVRFLRLELDILAVVGDHRQKNMKGKHSQSETQFANGS